MAFRFFISAYLIIFPKRNIFKVTTIWRPEFFRMFNITSFFHPFSLCLVIFSLLFITACIFLLLAHCLRLSLLRSSCFSSQEMKFLKEIIMVNQFSWWRHIVTGPITLVVNSRFPKTGAFHHHKIVVYVLHPPCQSE